MFWDDWLRFFWRPSRGINPETGTPQSGGTGVRYIPNADGKGWLIVLYENASRYPPLPQFVKVKVEKVEHGRDYFTILEGKSKGKRASVSHDNGRSRLLSGANLHQPAATVKFAWPAGKLWYGNTGPIEATTDEDNPVDYGTHAIEIPDEVHGLARGYEGSAKYATTWFRVGHSGDRYLHTGSVSAGCVTVTEIASWDKIYAYLIKARVGDGLTVGTIEVVNQ